MIEMQAYGYPPSTGEDDGLIPGRITAVHRGLFEAVCPHGFVRARLKAGAYYDGGQEHPTVGDFVRMAYQPQGDSLIVRTLERHSKFSRSDFSGHAVGYVKTVLEQVVAVNFDYVFIVSSLNQNFNLKRIQRYLALARQSGALPVVVLTKADLSPDWPALAQEARTVAGDAPVLAISAQTGFGLDQLGEYLRPGKTLVLLGSSGVGKSSLVNALAGQELMQVNAIREEDARGRHTTTHRQLMLLPCGAMVIDTPGMRELGLWEADAGLDQTFSDVEALTRRCRFSDCRHRTEPGCAVQAALANGSLPAQRWEDYLALQREAQFVEDKSAYLRKKDEWHKSLSKQTRKKK